MEKIKLFLESEKGKNILTVLIVILVGLGSFVLGRLSKEGSSGLKIDYTEPKLKVQSANILTATNSSSAAPKLKIQKPATVTYYFASKRGNKYYPVECSAGKTIKLENRIYFATKDEAERAGYTLSGSCD